jgi:hypothetical protein
MKVKGEGILFPVWEEEQEVHPSNWTKPTFKLVNNIVKFIWGIKREGELTLISKMSPDYKLIENQVIVDNCIEALKELGLKGSFNAKSSGEIGPNIYLITVDTSDKVIDCKDKVIFKQLISKNSYNGYTSWKLYIGFMHSYCSNGSINMSTEVELSNIHKKGVLKNIKDAVTKTLEKDNFLKLLERSHETKSENRYENVLENLSKVLSKKEMESFKLMFSFLNLKHQPIYELYSSLTWFNSHIIKPTGLKYMAINSIINKLIISLE